MDNSNPTRGPFCVMLALLALNCESPALFRPMPEHPPAPRGTVRTLPLGAFQFAVMMAEAVITPN